MKKAILSMCLIVLFSATALAASLYITTIQEANIEQVQDALIEVMTGKNFTINEVTPHKVTFNKNFGDGIFIATTEQTVIFNLISRDGNVKMMVTQTEIAQGVWKRQRSIDHLVPIIKDIRNAIDGTPHDLIRNEAVNQLPGAGNEREKTLGIVISEKDAQGKFRVEKVTPGSYAAEKQIAAGDILLEINGRSTENYDKSALESYIANKWGQGASLVFAFDRAGDIKVVTLKRAD